MVASSKDSAINTIANIMVLTALILIIFSAITMLETHQQTVYYKEIKDNCTAYMIASQDAIFRHCFRECAAKNVEGNT